MREDEEMRGDTGRYREIGGDTAKESARPGLLGVRVGLALTQEHRKEFPTRHNSQGSIPLRRKCGASSHSLSEGEGSISRTESSKFASCHEPLALHGEASRVQAWFKREVPRAREAGAVSRRRPSLQRQRQRTELRGGLAPPRQKRIITVSPSHSRLARTADRKEF